jgi:hypothetical protein
MRSVLVKKRFIADYQYYFLVVSGIGFCWQKNFLSDIKKSEKMSLFLSQINFNRQ